MRIHIFEMGDPKKHPLKKLRQLLLPTYWFPVINARRELREAGLQIEFFTTLSDQITDCDVLVLCSRSVDRHLRGDASAEARRALCERLRPKANKLVWFDQRDSAGNCQFEVLPFVDAYWKRSIYQDLKNYSRTFHAERIYADYYHKNYDVEDDDTVITEDGNAQSTTDDLEQLASKLRVAWGCGAEYHWPKYHAWDEYLYYRSTIAKRMFAGAPDVMPKITSPTATREMDVSALFNEKRYRLRTVGYQRKLGVEAANSLPTDKKIVGRVPAKDFYNCLADSKITVSVFGWGEVCYREYEASYAGAAITMADMSHIKTYPDFYRPDEFYAPFAWDFSDFGDVIETLLSKPTERVDMAQRAQDFLCAQWTPSGRRAFAAHVSEILPK